jgi:Flp pilus assembly protein TadD
MDPGYHVEWARAVASGRAFYEGPFFRAPLYPWFLAGLMAVFGQENLLAPRIVQAALGSLSCVLVYGIGARALNRRAGLLGSLFAATYWVSLYFEGELLLESISTPLNLLGLWTLLGLLERPTRARAFWSGACFGLAAVARPNILMVLPALALLIALQRAVARRAALLRAAFFALGCAVPIAPITLYNLIVGRDLVLISTQGGVNLWIGNNPHSDGSSAIVPFTRPSWQGGFDDSIAQAERAEGRSLKPSEVSHHYSRKALEFARSQPLDWLRLTLFKLRLFLTDYELGNNQEIVFFARRFGPITRYLPLSFAFVASMGLVGIALSRPVDGKRAALLLFLGLYSLSVVLFFVNGRFRWPIVPVLMPFAAQTTLAIIGAIRERRFAWLARVVPAAAALFLASRLGVPSSVDRSQSAGFHFLGVAALRDGDSALALEHLREAVARRPDAAISWRELGRAQRSLGLDADAEASYLRALALNPADFTPLSLLVDLFLAQGRVQEASSLASDLLQRAPHAAVAHYDHGRCLFQSGRTDEALQAFEHALEIQPDYFYANLALGLIRLEAGDRETAANHLRRAVEAGASVSPELLQQARSALERAH